MPETAPVTQGQFTEFKTHLDQKFEELTKSLTPIIDPEKGIFIRVSKNDDAISKAHERIDHLYTKANLNIDILKGHNGNPGVLDQMRDLQRFKATVVRVSWILLTPILAGIGLAIWAVVSAPK